jgi:hypothetical protein
MRDLYARVIFPRLLELSVGGKVFAKERTKALKSVHGEVLEVGFGTGLNLPNYPSSVTRAASGVASFLEGRREVIAAAISADQLLRIGRRSR